MTVHRIGPRAARCSMASSNLCPPTVSLETTRTWEGCCPDWVGWVASNLYSRRLSGPAPWPLPCPFVAWAACPVPDSAPTGTSLRSPFNTACTDPGTPYSYGPPTTCGISSKLKIGGGEETCHSSVRARHGLPGARGPEAQLATKL